MKKIKNFIMVSLMALMMTLISCGDSTLKAINKKIEKEGTSATFTQKEYAAMADYLDKNYMKMFKEFSKMDYEDDDIEEKLDKLENKYPNINEYMMILAFADAEGELDKKNSMKWKKISNDIKDYYKNSYGVDLNSINTNERYREDFESNDLTNTDSEELKELSLGGLYEGDSMSINIELLAHPKKDNNGDNYNIEGKGMFSGNGGRQGFDLIGNLYDNGNLILKEIDYGAPEYNIVLEGKLTQDEGIIFYEGTRYIDGKNSGKFKLCTDA